MNKIFLLIILFFAGAFYACNSNNNQKLLGYTDGESHLLDSANYTTIEWLDSTITLDTITEGQKVNLSFRFKNTGDKPLYLASVQPTCGCTITDFTKSAVMPGEQGLVTGVFNSANHPGEFRKMITARGNTKNVDVSRLVFTGFVKDTSTNRK